MEGYNYTKDYNHLEYHFSTLNGIFYSVKFSPNETFNSISNSENFNNVFQVILAKTTKEKEPFDYNVSATVRNIIVDFLQNNLNSIIYFCSYFDEKERQRFNAFNRWYEHSTVQDKISKFDNLVKIEDILLYTSLIINNNNPQKNEIVEIFDSLEDMLNQEK